MKQTIKAAKGRCAQFSTSSLLSYKTTRTGIIKRVGVVLV